MDCTFCDWYNKRKNIIYRRIGTVTYLADISYSRGHSIVCPIEHYTSVFDVPNKVLNEMYQSAVYIANRVKFAFDPKGFKISQNETVWNLEGELEVVDGETVNHVEHLHMQVIPLYEKAEIPPRRKIDEKEINLLINILRERE